MRLNTALLARAARRLVSTKPTTNNQHKNENTIDCNCNRTRPSTRQAYYCLHFAKKLLQCVKQTIEMRDMPKMVKKSFDAPEEARPIKRGKLEVVNLDGIQAMRVTFEPSWRSSECVKPVAGTE